MSQAAMKSPGHGSAYKEVRFSHPLVPIRRARSIASSNPLLDPAHQAARAAYNAFKEKTYNEYAVYINQSRSLLESQRLNFERERLLFAEERKLWDMERSVLKSRIAELESAARNGNTEAQAGHFRSDYRFQNNAWSSGLWQPNGAPAARDGDSQQQQEHPVWEGPIAGTQRPARVFPDEDDLQGRPNLYIPPTEANGFGLRTSLDAALSPQLFDRSAEISMPVPIEKVDSQLDGITLKSTALPPDVVAKVMTPPTSLSPTSSPPKGEPDTKSPSLKLKLSDLGQPQENLTRDAGHTPMAILGTETEASVAQSPSETELEEAEVLEREEAPLAPVVTKQPVESGDSYFPVVDDDPALTGPLTLENNEAADSSFLSQLDRRLLDEARKAILGGELSTIKVEEDSATEGEPDPELKLKASTNFGTAFGQC